jgi:anti-sigma regulatory factor (Ser/Thr protein kinase)
MFGYSPARGTAAAMDTLDAWPGSSAFIMSPYVEPSLELGMQPTWSTSTSVRASGVLGEIDLAATPAAVRLARSYVRELVGECLGLGPSVLDDLELLTSEAVTNSVMHARPRRDGTVMLSALHTGHTVRVEITDGGPRPGSRRPSGRPLSMEGRGLRLIETIAIDHGRYRDIAGSATFWFEVAIAAVQVDPADPAFA